MLSIEPQAGPAPIIQVTWATFGHLPVCAILLFTKIIDYFYIVI